MHDKENDVSHDPEEESFAELFESYSSGLKDDIEFGEKVRGRIIAIEKDTVFMDVGSKVDAMVEKSELLDDEGNLPYHVGDEIELFVVALSEHEIRLSKAISGVGGLAVGLVVFGVAREPEYEAHQLDPRIHARLELDSRAFFLGKRRCRIPGLRSGQGDAGKDDGQHHRVNEPRHFFLHFNSKGRVPWNDHLL